jgi:2-phosphosulfolactate phosphatase
VTFLPAHRQGAHAVRMEWGATGAAAVAGDVDIAVVVDVLSFTTTLTVAVDRGMRVHPFRWKDERAASYAAARGATLAGPRGPGVSLSSAAMLEVTGVDRIVLPSPNGSAISFGLAQGGARVVGASLRNRSAVAHWLPDGARVAVVAAGERWPDGSLRPAVEDLWGAGAVLAALVDGGAVGLSPEARVAEQAFRSVADRLPRELHACASGRELDDAGFAADVDVAAELDVCDVVPLLDGDAFVAP